MPEPVVHTPAPAPRTQPGSTIALEVQDYEAAYAISSLLKGHDEAEADRKTCLARGELQQAEVFRAKAEILKSLVERITRALVSRR